VIINLLFAGVEALAGIFIGSLALLADAGHNLTDVVGLGLGWVGIVLGRSRPTLDHTYGLRKVSILAALLSAVLILMAMGIIGWEAVQRFDSPVPPPAATIMIVAGVGVVINLATALLFVRGRREELNMKAAFLHMVADAAVSVGVVLAGLVVFYTGWAWVDPAVSLLIAGVIVIGTWDLLRESFTLAVDGVPRGIDLKAVQSYLRKLPGVTDVHDLHVWGLSTTETVLTAHLNVHSDEDEAEVLKRASEGLSRQFGVGHTTLQIERDIPCPTNDPCDS
jgi:cobalt-zinc-cadmium efflux system protein